MRLEEVTLTKMRKVKALTDLRKAIDAHPRAHRIVER